MEFIYQNYNFRSCFDSFDFFLARVLEEEWGRREALEKLQEEQRIMLEEERRKREEFEKEQSEKEGQLRGNYFQSLVMKKTPLQVYDFLPFSHFYSWELSEHIF